MSIRFLSEGPLAQVSGGYLYNRYLIEQLRRSGADTRYYEKPPELEKFDASDIVVVDSLIVDRLADRLLRTPARVLLLLHVVPSFSGSAGLLNSLSERAEVVVTGERTLDALRGRIETSPSAVKILPGVPHGWRVKERFAGSARKLLCVANYIPGKGIDRLIDVLTELRDLPWSLTVHGSGDYDPGYYQQLLQTVHSRGLCERIRLREAISHEEINSKMVESDLLVHFSRNESYSMVTAEAIASGLPVLSYRTGECASFQQSGLVHYVDDDGESDVAALAQLIRERASLGRFRRSESWRVRTCRDVGREFLEFLGRR